MLPHHRHLLMAWQMPTIQRSWCVVALRLKDPLPNPTSPGSPRAPCRGEELRQLVLDKWGVSYDVTLQRRGKNMYLHVM